MSRWNLLIAALLTALSVGQAKADSTVSAMTAASALNGAELLYCVQAAADRKCTVTQAQTFILASPTFTGTVTTPITGGGTQCLQVSNTGVLSGTAAGCGGSGTPGGSNGQVQYNSSGAFAGMTGTSWDNTNLALTITGATLTTSNPILNLSQTWNNGATTFTGLLFNVTNTASVAGSRVVDFQVGGVSQLAVDTAGNISTNSGGQLWQLSGVWGDSYEILQNGTTFTWFINGARAPLTGSFAWGSGGQYWNYDTALYRDAAGIIAQRNSTSAQTLRVYNTFTDASDYERGVLDWTTTANTLIMGAQSAGTGAARNVNIASGLHVNFTTGVPTANSCAGFALTTGSTDTAGKVSFTSATSCSITFANAFTNAPYCVVSPGSAASTHDAVTSTTGLAVTFGTANTSMQYVCFGT